MITINDQNLGSRRKRPRLMIILSGSVVGDTSFSSLNLMTFQPFFTPKSARLARLISTSPLFLVYATQLPYARALSPIGNSENGLLQ